MTTRTFTHALPTAMLIAAGLLAPGCRDSRSDKPPHQFFPDMDDQQRWNPQAKSDFFADQRTMRQPPKGSVAFGRVQFVSSAEWARPFMDERDVLLKEDDRIYLGIGSDGKYIPDIPLEVTEQMIRRGQERFNIYCSVCHGFDGKGGGDLQGGGMVGRQWSYPLPNFHDVKYIDKAGPDGKALDGYLFHTVRYGVVLDGQEKMPPYGHALNEHDAWAVVAYIRTLQASHSGTLADIATEADRVELERRRPAVKPVQPVTPVPPATPTTAPAAPGATPAQPAPPPPASGKTGGAH